MLKRTDLTIIEPDQTLSREQYQQMCEIITEGFGSKFKVQLPIDTGDKKLNEKNRKKSIKLVSILVSTGLLPMNGRFAAIKEEKVVGVLLLNIPGKQHLVKFLIQSLVLLGPVKTFRFIMAFGTMDAYNKKRVEEVEEIFWVNTGSQYRGQGIGTYLINYTLNYVRTRASNYDIEYGKIALVVFKSNSNAIRVYEDTGFIIRDEEPTPEFDRYMGEGFEELIRMAIPLNKVVQ